jgi:hypothetical protein
MAGVYHDYRKNVPQKKSVFSDHAWRRTSLKLQAAERDTNCSFREIPLLRCCRQKQTPLTAVRFIVIAEPSLPEPTQWIHLEMTGAAVASFEAAARKMIDKWKEKRLYRVLVFHLSWVTNVQEIPFACRDVNA